MWSDVSHIDFIAYPTDHWKPYNWGHCPLASNEALPVLCRRKRNPGALGTAQWHDVVVLKHLFKRKCSRLTSSICSSMSSLSEAVSQEEKLLLITDIFQNSQFVVHSHFCKLRWQQCANFDVVTPDTHSFCMYVFRGLTPFQTLKNPIQCVMNCLHRATVNIPCILILLYLALLTNDLSTQMLL